ncbi:hypothetical protein KKF55_06065 [Patescibacteria group bacterium]|nr:hypothetical protein [Patescibacteria group bacterium]
MSESSSKTLKKWEAGERGYNYDTAEEKTRDLFGSLELIRTHLGDYRRALALIVKQIVEDTPYDNVNHILDGFISRRILRIYSQFAKRLQDVGINDVDCPNEGLEDAEFDFPGYCADGIEYSGGLQYPLEFNVDDLDRVQIGNLDLDIRGTCNDPLLFAELTSNFLFECVLKGFKEKRRNRPGLAERMLPLEEYGEIDMTIVRAEISLLLKKVRSISFQTVD